MNHEHKPASPGRTQGPADRRPGAREARLGAQVCESDSSSHGSPGVSRPAGRPGRLLPAPRSAWAEVTPRHWRRAARGLTRGSEPTPSQRGSRPPHSHRPRPGGVPCGVSQGQTPDLHQPPADDIPSAATNSISEHGHVSSGGNPGILGFGGSWAGLPGRPHPFQRWAPVHAPAPTLFLGGAVSVPPSRCSGATALAGSAQ